MVPASQSWIDRTLGNVAPRWQLQRVRARIASELVQRHYEGASTGRRTQTWNRASGDANSVHGGATLARLREVARDLVRNNPYAASAVATIADHVVGWGITAKPLPASPAIAARWNAWAGTTACDADGRHDLAGLEKLVVRSVVESGEVLVRRRIRRLEDGLPIPIQLQVLEADFLDTSKSRPLPGGGKIVQGVEYNALGARVAYWLYPEHPGASLTSASALFSPSRRIPASDVQHVFDARRPGQVRAASWFSPVLLRMKDFDEYEDATLMKQKIAACLCVITSDVDGTSAPLGTADDTVSPATDTIEPGALINAPAGRSMEVVQPPTVREYGDYCSVTLRAIAAGLGLTYEDLTGDYTDLPFSAARMSRLRHWARVEDWRWRMVIPQFCGPVWGWAMQALVIQGDVTTPPVARWSAPPAPMIDPAAEGLAYQRNVRTGIQSLSEAIRERGYDPDELLEEMAGDNMKLDALKLVLDSDPRRMTQAGQAQALATLDNGTRSEFGRTLDRFAAFLSSLPDDKAVDIFAAMFGERKPRSDGE
jgi:lambda family phage portal protein